MTTIAKLTLKRDAYLTDGTRLVRVTRSDKDEVWVEDASDLIESTLSRSDLASGDWRNVEPAPEEPDAA